MPQVSIRIPQIGEGLTEARLVAMLKQPGDAVRRDEPIYQMETDKAVLDVESPYEGVLSEWLAKPDDILPIGAEVAKMEVQGEVKEMTVHGVSAPTGAAAQRSEPMAASASRNVIIPPRTRAYAKEKGLTDEQLASLASGGSKLMPEDVDRYLAGAETGSSTRAKSAAAHRDAPVPQKQRVLNSRMVRGNTLVVPGTISLAVKWDGIESERAKQKAAGSDFQPSAFTMFAYAVAVTLRDFAALKTALIGEETFRTYDYAQLGIAVGLPGDELVLAVVEDADSLSWFDFAKRARQRIEEARGGKDQANEAVTLSLTNMQAFGLRDAVPVVVPPSCATMFLGEVYNGLDPQASDVKMVRLANLALTFDHRVMNGVGAAQFLNAVRQRLEAIGSIL